MKQLPFFVYGTLLPGQPNAHLWRRLVQEEQVASFAHGLLYDMGSFPMLLAASPDRGSVICGRLLTPKPDKYLEVLTRFDNLEGYNPDDLDASAFWRTEVNVCLSNNRQRSAWVYLGNPRYAEGLTPIDGGHWPSYAAARASEIEGWWASFESLFPSSPEE